MTADTATETYLLELKCGPDPYRRHGINREPIYRLKRLLKFAVRDGGFKINWGKQPAPENLVERTTPDTAMIRLADGPAEEQLLMLRRAPLYLRVVYDARRKRWDALDQFKDKPSAGEAVFAYRRVGEPSAMMLDWTEGGRRRGSQIASATYILVSEQPDDATLRDTKLWRAWCWSQVKEPTLTGESP